MNIDIRTNLHLDLHGFSAAAIGKDYTGTAFKLMDKMWRTVKASNLQNKGQNIWIYEPNEMVFAGIELLGLPIPETELQPKKIILEKYAYYKHIGPYNLIKTSGLSMREELANRSIKIISPYIEIYGHWTNDENKLETELLMAIE